MIKISANIVKISNSEYDIVPLVELTRNKRYYVHVGSEITSQDGNSATNLPKEYYFDTVNIVYLQDIDSLRNTSTNLTMTQSLNFNDDNSYDQTDPNWEAKKLTWTTTGFPPIDSYSGNFNGNNFAISNLLIDLPTTDFVGLFSSMYDNGSLLNINISGNVTGQNYVGGLIGDFGNIDIVNCHSNVNVVGNDYVGGLVGSGGYDVS